MRLQRIIFKPGSGHKLKKLLRGMIRSDLNLRAKHLYARCLMRRGNYEEAHILLHQTMKVNAFNIERLVDLGNSLLEIGHVTEALQNFTDVLDIDPSHKRGIIGRGKCLLLEKQFNEALSFLGELSSKSEVASVFNAAAILCVKQDRFNDAMNLYKVALGYLAGEPMTQAKVLFNIALSFHKMEKMDAAKSCYLKVLRLDPSFQSARINLRVLGESVRARPNKDLDFDLATLQADLSPQEMMQRNLRFFQ